MDSKFLHSIKAWLDIDRSSCALSEIEFNVDIRTNILPSRFNEVPLQLMLLSDFTYVNGDKSSVATIEVTEEGIANDSRAPGTMMIFDLSKDSKILFSDE